MPLYEYRFMVCCAKDQRILSLYLATFNQDFLQTRQDRHQTRETILAATATAALIIVLAPALLLFAKVFP